MAMPISLMEYSLNKNFIASHLCENRTKSEMHCAGKCYLSKKLAKSNDSQDAQDQKGSTKITIVDFCESFEKPSLEIYLRNLQHNSFRRISKIPDSILTTVFRPPIV